MAAPDLTPTHMLPASSADAAGPLLALAISPAGHAYLEPSHGDADGLAPAVAARIRQAFDRGAAHGLLQLGAAELGQALPASLAFGREFAHRFMQRLTAVATLAEDWAQVELPAPDTELEQLAAAAPPMTGAEYLDGALLAAWWADLHTAVREAIAAAAGDVRAWLQGRHPSWNLVGRVCFHLAENKNNEQAPFAFLATYASHVSQQARVQHVPLGRALQTQAGAQDRAALLNLLEPV